MASPEQIDQILDLLKKYAPEKRYREFNRTTMGAGAVLLCLSNADAPVSAGQIGRFLNVSSARVAVLLKKMEGKGMITTGHPLSDARITMVQITECGRSAFCRVEQELRGKVAHVIDCVGMNRLMEYAAIADEIQKAMDEQPVEQGEKEKESAAHAQ
jgi:DNA-binding MarR family transcriptional regulator